MQMMGVGEGHRKAVLRRLARDARVARIVAWVWAIPEGYVRTYGDIEPRAPRLVGHCPRDHPRSSVAPHSRKLTTVKLGAKP
jgi:alkylated DNA nucleotide flippase Atl1